MKKLVSLPPNLVGCFHEIAEKDHDEWFCCSDPEDRKAGSGGGTAWILRKAFEQGHKDGEFNSWLKREKRIVIHAGGQSRRLPAYAATGKVLTPIPVFRWERGQRLGQTLLDLQTPLYERIMNEAPPELHTMVVSGDVYIRCEEQLPPLPNADVVCFGLWLDSETASHHGVFVSDKKSPQTLKCMLQKPSVDTLNSLQKDHYYQTDIGIWMLSDKAVSLLMDKTTDGNSVKTYDLYSDFGQALGTHPTKADEILSELSVAIVPLTGGEFYHFGTTHELISSTLAIQNRVNDQRQILQHSRKPHPAMFIQNAVCKIKIDEHNQNLWIENSHIGEHWQLESEHVITGIPENDWHIKLKRRQCVDMVPIGEHSFVVRTYDYYDNFEGNRQFEPLFPIAESLDIAETLLRHMLQIELNEEAWNNAQKMSAEQISANANLRRLAQQRNDYRNDSWLALAENHRHSVFYQLDLHDAARQFVRNHLPLPDAVDDNAPILKRMNSHMFRARVMELSTQDNVFATTNNPSLEESARTKEETSQAKAEEEKSFALMRQSLTDSLQQHQTPMSRQICSDQIVWGRCPVRIDIAGGWTDTPPYCMLEGGSVVNLAIELNGQPPLQTYIKPCPEPKIILRSIDLGAEEVITSYDQLRQFHKVGSPFSIPKAALALVGFLPENNDTAGITLKKQLEDFGSGIEITLLSAIPAGSGLGTSSLLAATVLGSLSDFCGLGWDKMEIGRQTLILEQMLTTGGGWQDQYGGLLAGTKLLQTKAGSLQTPVVRYLPDNIFTQPGYRDCHLLYYTGITRTAKTILSEIVKRMMLNDQRQLALLREMKQHAMTMFDAIQRADFEEMGRCVRKNWLQNQQLDSGTNPDEIRKITNLIDDLCLGYKLPGAGGGGYLYMVAKDPEAALRIRQVLTAQATNPKARFVDMTLSTSGLQVSRS